MKKKMGQYEFACKLRLLELNMTQRELIEKTKEKTGLYVDSSVISKLFRGEYVSPKIRDAIEDIIGLAEVNLKASD